ncbi:MAG: hypothetical protein ACI85O_002034 [Saprospiraceae bacterium]|jgi:hypothetical protein
MSIKSAAENIGSSKSDTLSEAQMLLQLQDILLKKDRQSLDILQQTLNDKELLSKKVSPIIEEHLTFLKQNFPKEFQNSVEKIIDIKLKDSQEEILNLIYPKLGKMIQKYIGYQFQQLKDSIDAQIEVTLNKGPFGWVRRKVFGIKVSDEILSGVDKPIIEQILIIQRDSGLLLGSATKSEKIHEDLVAGMLTAIKSFAEDAFERGEADLEMIQYDSYRIHLQNFPKYYIAVVLGGSMSAQQKENLANDLLTFAEEEMNIPIAEVNTEMNNFLKGKLERSFFTETSNDTNDTK